MKDCCLWANICRGLTASSSKVRSCWGPQERHTEAVEWFLDNGVPIEDIYGICMEMSKNPGTKDLLRARMGDQEPEL